MKYRAPTFPFSLPASLPEKNTLLHLLGILALLLTWVEQYAIDLRWSWLTLVYCILLVLANREMRGK